MSGRDVSLLALTESLNRSKTPASSPTPIGSLSSLLLPGQHAHPYLPSWTPLSPGPPPPPPGHAHPPGPHPLGVPHHHQHRPGLDVTVEEATIVTLILVLWVVAIVLFIHRWGKIRMLVPHQPRYAYEQAPTADKFKFNPSVLGRSHTNLLSPSGYCEPSMLSTGPPRPSSSSSALAAMAAASAAGSASIAAGISRHRTMNHSQASRHWRRASYASVKPSSVSSVDAPYSASAARRRIGTGPHYLLQQPRRPVSGYTSPRHNSLVSGYTSPRHNSLVPSNAVSGVRPAARPTYAAARLLGHDDPDVRLTRSAMDLRRGSSTTTAPRNISVDLRRGSSTTSAPRNMDIVVTLEADVEVQSEREKPSALGSSPLRPSASASASASRPPRCATPLHQPEDRPQQPQMATADQHQPQMPQLKTQRRLRQSSAESSSSATEVTSTSPSCSVRATRV